MKALLLATALTSPLAWPQDQAEPPAPVEPAPDLPVKLSSEPAAKAWVRNPLPWEQLTHVVGPSEDGRGLALDLGDAALQGTLYCGPYPFEAGLSDYDHVCYRSQGSVRDGKATIELKKFFDSRYNANDWPEGRLEAYNPTPTVAYRLWLQRVNEEGRRRDLGYYDARCSFRRSPEGVFAKALTISEGPFVAQVTSDDPTRLVITFETDEPAVGRVRLFSGEPAELVATFGAEEPRRKHEVLVTGLEPGLGYRYLVEAAAAAAPDEGEPTVTGLYDLHTAPPRGYAGKTRFAFISDSREGYGGLEARYAGHNRGALLPLMHAARRAEAEFFLIGGDLVNGSTSSVEDFRLQLRAWKNTASGFMRTRAVYTAMGNHERLVNAYAGESGKVWLDKFPYETDSAEAVFAEAFCNPTNAPEPSDPRRPSYAENVYRFQYGSTLVVAFNNNYWWSLEGKIAEHGGAPEGYIMEDQLRWIEETLVSAEEDSTIRFVLLFAQEPVFPCGGHVGDAMWYRGNNNVRACTYRDGVVEPEKLGIIEVRNRLWRSVAQSSKVAAVMAGDEHAYHRLLIDAETPVGVLPQDDPDGDGVLDTWSPEPAFTHPTWQLTAGTGGAPYYNRQATPWEPVRYDSQTGYLLFETEGDRISVRFITATGQVTDAVDDLMAVKR